MEAYLGQYFYENCRPSVKLWRNVKSQKDLTWDNLVKKTTRTISKAKILKDRDLEEYYLWDKKLLKLMNETYNK